MTSTSLSYRPLTFDDLDLLLPMMRELQADDPWSVPFDEPQVRATISELLLTPSAGRAFVILQQDRAIGYLVLSFDFSLEYAGKNAWIDELFVSREFRGQGIGAEAVRFAEEASRDCGARYLHLEVNRGNPAIALYRRCGFEEHDRFLLSKDLL
jgi:GNAT superfamily N-acetyltransferase